MWTYIFQIRKGFASVFKVLYFFHDFSFIVKFERWYHVWNTTSSIDSFDVIFDHFLTHIGQYLSQNLTNVSFYVLKSWRFICINTVFIVAPQKNLMVSNRMILVASWYRHDEKLRGQEMSPAIKPYSLEWCGMWHRLVFFNNRQKKVAYHNTITLQIDGDSRSIIVFEEVRCNHWPFLDVRVSLQLLEDSQNPICDNFVY